MHHALTQPASDAYPRPQRFRGDEPSIPARNGELTREEAERIRDYLRRDTEEVARYLEETRQDFHDWFRFDLALVEQRFMQMFELMVDQTRTELQRLSDRAQGIEEWHTGEVAAPGALFCTSCGKEMHMHKSARVPPCPKCHATVFRRFPEGGEASD